MPVYTVHIDQTDSEPVKAVERMVLVPDGFNVRAFLFGPFWLLFRGLLLALAAWLLAALIVGTICWTSGLSGIATLMIYWCSALVLGLEASTLRRWRLARKGFAQVDISSGSNPEEAERRFLDRQELAAENQTLPQARQAPVAESEPTAGWQQIGGLFPSGGAL